MSEQAFHDRFRVRGDNAPTWLPWVFLLVGFVGSIFAAQMLLPYLSERFAALPGHMGVGARAIQADPPRSGSERGDVQDATGLAEEQEATPDEKKSRLPAVADGGLGPEQIPVAFTAEWLPQVDAAARRLEPGESPAPGGSTTQDSSTPQGEPEQASRQQIGPASSQAPELTKAIEAQGSSGPMSEPKSEGHASAMQARLPHLDDAGSERSADGRAVDCAPLFSIGFDRGMVEPQGSGIDERIANLAHWLEVHPEAIVYVDGHADPVGPEESNLVISFRRAVAVAARLTAAGVSKAQLVVRAYGEGQSPSPASQWVFERRVRLKIEDGAYMPCRPGASYDGDHR